MRARTGSAFAPAVAASAALVLSSPVIGEIRAAIAAAFPGSFITLVGAAIALSVLGAMVWAFVSIRDHRARRYALVAAAVVLAVGYSKGSGVGDPSIDAVERFHFVEYGVIALLFYRAWRPLDDAGVVLLPFLGTFAVGICDEWFQWFVPARVGEMHDVFLNGAAIVSGLLLGLAINPPARSVFAIERRSLAQVAGVAVMATILFAAFVNCVHIGYQIVDPEIGSFRSIYSAAELGALSGERASRWATDPPILRPPRLSREDQYMSEGLWHVQARNRASSANDVTVAWYENVILEKYFRPVLETPSYLSAVGSAWAPEQRADAQRRAAILTGASNFVSHAEDPFPILAWSKRTFWISVAAVVLGIVAAYWLLARLGLPEPRRAELSCEPS